MTPITVEKLINPIIFINFIIPKVYLCKMILFVDFFELLELESLERFD